MVLARRQDMFSHDDDEGDGGGREEDEEEEEEAAAWCWDRKAEMRSSTYSVTCVRISRPRISSCGRSGERATRRPPKPQPMSATVTGFVKGLISPVAAASVLPHGWAEAATKAG